MGSLRSGRLLLFLLLLAWVAGCGGKPAYKAPCQYTYEQEAVAVNLAAAPDLNSTNNQPHTVLVLLYQLADPNMFKQLLETQEGVGRLLEGKAFDGSVVSRRQLVVQPGEVKPVKMDRVQGARYLGVVAGFYNQQAQNFSRLYPIPTRIERSLFGKEKSCYSLPLEIALRLGSDGFVGSE